MITVTMARIVCYAPGDFGVLYEFSDGGIGGRPVGNLGEAEREVARIKDQADLRRPDFASL